MVAKETSFVRERKNFEARLVEEMSLSDAALTEMKTHPDRVRDEVDHLCSVRGTVSVEVKKTRRELTGAQEKI